MWKSCSTLIFACALAVGCKEAGVDRPAEKSDDTTATGSNNAGRSGKVDFGTRRRPQPGGDSGDSGGEDGQGYEPGAPRPGVEDRRRQRIAQFDHDGDGKISEEERKAARHRRAEDLAKSADKDGNGKVSVEEFSQSSFRRLDPAGVDTNKDGEVTVSEIEAALESRNRAWGGGRNLRDRFGAGFKDRPGAGSAAPN